MEPLRPVRLRLSLDAITQLDEIYAYIAERNEAGATKVLAQVQQAFVRLCQFPHLGRPGGREGTREWSLPSIRYTIVYRVDVASDELAILGVFHSRQNKPRAGA